MAKDTLARRYFRLKQLQWIIQSGKWRDSSLFANLQLTDIDNLNFIIDLMEQEKYGIIRHG